MIRTLTTCEKHDRCVIVYDEFSNGVREWDCPICVMIKELEDELEKTSNDSDHWEREVGDRDATIAQLEIQIQELEQKIESSSETD